MASPKVIEMYRKVKAKYFDAHVSWTFRGERDQELCFATGVSKAHWPDSPHNKMKENQPCSIAMDLFRLNGYGCAEWKEKWFREIAEHLKLEGIALIWGGDFKSLKDYDHFETKPEIV